METDVKKYYPIMSLVFKRKDEIIKTMTKKKVVYC